MTHATTDREYIDKKLMTMAEVAAEYGIPLATLRFWRATGRGPKFRRIGRRVMARRSDCEQWIAEQFDSERGEHK